MKPFTTSETLLEKIKSGDEIAWHEFYANYARLIWVCAGDFRLRPHEREDLIQMVMLEVFKMQRHFRYDRGKGRFRDYLRTVIRHQAIQLINRNRRSQANEEAADRFEGETHTFARHWEDEWRTYLLEQSLSILKLRMEPATYQAFTDCIAQRLTPTEIATKLGMKTETVYVIKNRGIAILKNTIHALEDSY